MAAVPITITGTFTSDAGQTTSGTLQGLAFITGLSIGGGPIIPPDKPKPPVGIWPDPPEGIAPHPEHPIVIPPTKPPKPPVGIWPDPPEGIAPHPEHPIVIPRPPVDLPPQPPDGTPDDDGFLKPPPSDGGWSYHKDYAWGYYPKPGESGPKG